MSGIKGWHLRPDGHTWKALPIGAERIRESGSQHKKLWFVKVSNEICSGENRVRAAYQWEKKHLLLWRNAYGEIPKGYKIAFLNGDTLDCRLENLYMISDAAHMLMVKYDLYSSEPEITKTAILLCELMIAMRNKERK